MHATPLKQIVIQGTSTCNLNCDYCYLEPEERKKHKVMSPNTARAVFKNIFSSPIVEGSEGFDINWHAGEPLTQPISYYAEILSIIKEIQLLHGKEDLAVTHTIQTNATLINDQWCEFFNKHGVRLGISLDGPQFLHDLHRKDWQGKGSHGRVMRGINYLKKHRVPFGILCVLTKDTLDRADEWFEFFQTNSLNYIGLQIEEIEAANKQSSLDGEEALHQYRTFINRLWQLNKQQSEPLYIREFKNVAKRLFHPDISGEVESFLVPFQTLSIDSEGNFSTFSPELLTMKSSHYGDFILGNLQTDTFESVLDTDKFKRMLADIQAGADLCQQKCEYAELCGGLWIPNKYSENGTFVSTETMACRLKIKTLFDVVLDDLCSELPAN